MKIVTPFDLWRAGFEAWLTAWQAQIAMGERMMTGLTAWQQALRESVPEGAPVAAAQPAPRARKRA
jgi:hypothetical protein